MFFRDMNGRGIYFKWCSAGTQLTLKFWIIVAVLLEKIAIITKVFEALKMMSVIGKSNKTGTLEKSFCVVFIKNKRDFG